MRNSKGVDDAQCHAEFYRIFFEQDKIGFWLARLDKPLRIDFPIEKQITHVLQHAYLAKCNQTFARMYGCSSSSDLIGARFPQLFVPTDPNNLINLRTFLKSRYSIVDAESHEVDVNGQPRCFLNSCFGVVEGKFLVRVWGKQRDITQIKLDGNNRNNWRNRLTPKQQQILELTTQGRSLKQIGETMKMSAKTVSTIRTRVMKKVGVQETASLIREALKEDLTVENELRSSR